MIKFNDEQLSKILTAHASGGLERYGALDRPGYPGCIMQIAFGLSRLISSNDVTSDPWFDINWFDENYNSGWSEEEFLEKLAERGMV